MSADYRFSVAISFAGDNKRNLVRQVAEILRDEIGDDCVFFDEWFEAEIAGQDANTVLQNVYLKSSQLVVTCVCKRYNEKPWTQDEWRAIQSLERTLRDAGTENKKRMRFLPLRFGDGDIDALFDTAIVPDVRERSPKQIADLILQRLKLSESENDTDSNIFNADSDISTRQASAKNDALSDSKLATLDDPARQSVELLGKPTAQYLPISLRRLAAYYCDRTTQRLRFQRALSQRLSKPAGIPLHTVISGAEEQCTDMLVQQMFTEDLPRILERNRHRPYVQDFVLHWPTADSDSSEDDLEILRSGLYDALDLGLQQDDAPLNNWLARTGVTLVLRLTLDVHSWKDRDEALLEAWFSWWSELWQERSHQVLVFIRLTSSPGFFKHFRFGYRTRAIHNAFSRISTSVGENHSLLLLDELQGVKFSDIEKWLSESEVLHTCDRVYLRERVREFFEQKSVSGTPLPMNTVAEFLKGLLVTQDCTSKEIQKRVAPQ